MANQPPERTAYLAAYRRCTDLKNADFPNYGGRGIKFLFTTFEQFMLDIGPRPHGATLDRKNNNRHYEPGNVRWATRTQQQRNRRPFYQQGTIYEASHSFYVRYFQ